MTNRQLEEKLRLALGHAVPETLDGIVGERGSENTEMEEIPSMKRSGRNWAAIAAAACLALVLAAGGLVYRQNFAVASVISLDVNPSIQIQVNRKERVLSCSALNEDASEILSRFGGGADLKGASLTEAVNEVVGSLTHSGYLGSASSAILISVTDKDQRRAAQLQEKLTTTVDEKLLAEAASGRVITQAVPFDRQLSSRAASSHISAGKATLVEQVIGLNADLSFEDLAALSVEELCGLISAEAPGMPIGSDAALQAAKDYAGELFGSLGGKTNVEFEDDGTGYYKVELEHPEKGELELLIDAYTGAVIGEIWDKDDGPDDDLDDDLNDDLDDLDDDDPDDLDDSDDLDDDRDGADDFDDDRDKDVDADDDRDVDVDADDDRDEDVDADDRDKDDDSDDDRDQDVDADDDRDEDVDADDDRDEDDDPDDDRDEDD